MCWPYSYGWFLPWYACIVPLTCWPVVLPVVPAVLDMVAWQVHCLVPVLSFVHLPSSTSFGDIFYLLSSFAAPYRCVPCRTPRVVQPAHYSVLLLVQLPLGSLDMPAACTRFCAPCGLDLVVVIYAADVEPWLWCYLWWFPGYSSCQLPCGHTVPASMVAFHGRSWFFHTGSFTGWLPPLLVIAVHAMDNIVWLHACGSAVHGFASIWFSLITFAAVVDTAGFYLDCSCLCPCSIIVLPCNMWFCPSLACCVGRALLPFLYLWTLSTCLVTLLPYAAFMVAFLPLPYASSSCSNIVLPNVPRHTLLGCPLPCQPYCNMDYYIALVHATGRYPALTGYAYRCFCTVAIPLYCAAGFLVYAPVLVLPAAAVLCCCNVLPFCSCCGYRLPFLQVSLIAVVPSCC